MAFFAAPELPQDYVFDPPFELTFQQVSFTGKHRSLSLISNSRQFGSRTAKTISALCVLFVFIIETVYLCALDNLRHSAMRTVLPLKSYLKNAARKPAFRNF